MPGSRGARAVRRVPEQRTVAEPQWLRARDVGGGRSERLRARDLAHRLHARPDTIDSAGDGVLRWGGAFKRHHGEPASAAAVTQEVFGVCGAACMMRARCSRRSAGSTRTSSRRTKTDLSYPRRLRGYRCRVRGDAVVRHVGSATLGTSSPFSVFHGQRNLEWMYFKDTPGSLLLRTLPGHLVYGLAAGCTSPHRHAASLSACKGRRLPACRDAPQARGGSRDRRVAASDIAPLLDTKWLSTKLREKRSTRGLRGRVVENDRRPMYAAVLVNYNAGAELERALRSISDELAGTVEGVVVDTPRRTAARRPSRGVRPRQADRQQHNAASRGVNQGLRRRRRRTS